MNASTMRMSDCGTGAIQISRDHGWAVFPAKIEGKSKSSYKSAKYSGGRNWGATSDPEQVRADFLRWPAALVGIATQESGLVVLDLDNKNGVNGVEWLADKITEHGEWPDTVEAMSPSGGWHVYFNYPDFDPKTCQGEMAPGVDVRGHGGMVLAPPSKKPGQEKGYYWKNPPGLFDVADAPQWVLDLLPRREGPKQKDGAEGAFDFNTGSRWKAVEDYRRLVLDASTDGKKHEATRDIANSLAGQGVTQKFATGLIQAICPVWDENLQKSIDSAFEKFSGNKHRHVGADLIRDDKGLPIWNMANAVTLLSDHDDWQGVLGYNAFTVRRVVLRAIPGQTGGTFPRTLEDDDYSAAQQWFNRNGFPKATAPIVESAVRKVCRNRTFDPLTDYLDGLKWDGTLRLKSWLWDYCGTDINDYTSEAGMRWCISAVARAYKPGCKADHMLVLEGEQGQRKSTALSTLAGEDWFSDALPQMGTKDASSYLRGKWIIEIAELEAMRREMDGIKAFITRQTETFRPAYGREEVSEPRRCVFAGTTNKDDWQRDETGGRRFWPIKVGVIDVPALEADRDQLWAEAVQMFRKGERWWMQGDIEVMAQEEVSYRQADDPWLSNIDAAVSGLKEVSPKQVLSELGIAQADMTPALSKRVAQALVSMGWRREGRFTTAANKGAFRYVPCGEAR